MKALTNILVMNDQPNHLNYLAASLRAEQYPVSTATNGEDALGMLLDGDYDVAIVDVSKNMPKSQRNGLQVAEQVMRSGIKTRFIVVSNETPDVKDVMKALNMGVKAWIEFDSIEMDDLINRIEKAL